MDLLVPMCSGNVQRRFRFPDLQLQSRCNAVWKSWGSPGTGACVGYYLPDWHSSAHLMPQWLPSVSARWAPLSHAAFPVTRWAGSINTEQTGCLQSCFHGMDPLLWNPGLGKALEVYGCAARERSLRDPRGSEEELSVLVKVITWMVLHGSVGLRDVPWMVGRLKRGRRESVSKLCLYISYAFYLKSRRP